jgi:hypothetical protein
MTEAPPLSKIVEGFAAGVQAACALLDSFQPDLVLVLLHSGMAPLRVTQALWEATRDIPFPPVVATNIGREKSEYYLDLPEHQGDNTYWFDICSGGWDFVGWALHETDWATQLARQLASRLPQGFTPQRVLILDDWVGYSVTQHLVEALLKKVYPLVEVRHFADFANAWCDTLGQLWLRKQHAEVYRSWWKLARAAKMEERNFQLYADLCLLVPGTEDVAPDSLDWQTITAHSSLLECLLTYLPAEEWLTLPGWAEATLLAQVMATVLA